MIESKQRVGLVLHRIDGELVEVSLWLLDAETLKQVIEIPCGPIRKWLMVSGHSGIEGADTLVMPEEVTVHLSE